MSEHHSDTTVNFSFCKETHASIINQLHDAWKLHPAWNNFRDVPFVVTLCWGCRASASFSTFLLDLNFVHYEKFICRVVVDTKICSNSIPCWKLNSNILQLPQAMAEIPCKHMWTAVIIPLDSSAWKLVQIVACACGKLRLLLISELCNRPNWD